MRYVASPQLAPGSVYRNVIVSWDLDPVWVLRPIDVAMAQRQPVLATEADPAAFEAQEDDLVSSAKKRPVLVIASRDEIGAGGPRRAIRVIPIYSRGDKPFYQNNWDAIVRGDMAGLVSMSADSGLGFAEGVLDLRQLQPVKRAFLEGLPWFGLDRPSLGGVLLALERLQRLALT